ncbi:MAG: hemolysin family protein [Gammaproteobacteria bacterium]|nr:hemolysin family protein [Gammaproteobacteria bacterium]MDH3448744.1 hemolysin family protein [Gammaproteobacteria bacterium]
MDNTSNLLAIILLLAANGFYVASEFALVKARGFRIESLANDGSAAARLTMRIQANLEPYLAACQLGITMASLGLGWVGEPAVAAILEPLFRDLGMSEQLLHTTAFIVGFLIFSALHIVIGEQVPKTLAIRKPEPVSIWIAFPLHFSYLLVWPLNWVLNRTTNVILTLLKVAEVSHVEVLTGAEIQGLVATSQQHGEIHESQATMLHNLFAFDQRRVGRIMLPINAVHVLDISAPAEKNLQIIKETEHSRFPLIDSNNHDALTGMVLAKDIHRAILNGKAEPWTDLEHLRRETMVVPETQLIAKLFDLMRTERAHMACVVDEYGSFVGIVTLEDLLEEIVGEIEDETDAVQPSHGVIQIDDNSWEVDGLTALSDIERVIGFEVRDEVDANTISGYFMRRLARMPVIGDEVAESGFRLQVTEQDAHRVGKVRIIREETDDDAGDPA